MKISTSILSSDYWWDKHRVTRIVHVLITKKWVKYPLLIFKTIGIKMKQTFFDFAMYKEYILVTYM
jgi:hypothetical protein